MVAIRTFDSALVLRAPSDGAETSTAAETGIAFDADKFGSFAAVVHVTAIDRTTGDEQAVFSIEADTASGFSSPVAVATLPAVTATGTYEIPLSGRLIEQHELGATHLRIKATLSGTTPSVTYGAYLAPVG
ncbi:hypothetical protein [Magnetospirillum fulvum]|uniref:Uncharacterized protein n=1 Tax=Magnetospirillum fulvum MGU-K5 TaxID=1316936 RepID=S9S9A6_MAGFU|nr:hypothetical protein [Magnetospirillum fulvum]EPY00608.1 hypothetical protein K678_15174 [Magnetospirillum fulvum MGU-K5]